MIDTRFYHELSKIRVSELAEKCGFKIIGEGDFEICGISTLKGAVKSDLSFLNIHYFIYHSTSSAEMALACIVVISLRIKWFLMVTMWILNPSNSRG